MRGRYEQAPLSYVTARLVIKELTQLFSDQNKFLIQEMKLIGFIYRETVTGSKIEFNLNSDSQKVVSEELIRTCFLTSDRREAILFDDDGIEFRTTKYRRFDDLCESFQKVMEVITQIKVYNSLKIEEVALAYVDVIVSDGVHQLSDFFRHGSNILPLNFLDDEDCLISFGKKEVNKVLRQNHRVEICLEELPQMANQYVPKDMAELEPRFHMPIDIPYKLDPHLKDKYVLVSTIGYELHGEEINRQDDGNLSGKSIREFFSQSHETCRKEFNKIINKNVCDRVWGYIED
ncbi:TIGR04255 family protein [Providencia huaxiensis]